MGRSHSVSVRRRGVAAALGAATATAGCVAGYAGRTFDDGEVEILTLAEQEVPPTTCERELSPDDIRAVDDPAFGPGDAWPADSGSCRPLEATSTIIGLWGDVLRAHTRFHY